MVTPLLSCRATNSLIILVFVLSIFCLPLLASPLRETGTGPALSAGNGGENGNFENADLNAICPPPLITVQPTAGLKCPGETLTLSVTASSNGPGTLTYQWKKGGVNIPGATGAIYVIPSITVANEASYTVVVTKSCGANATSTTVTLDLNLVNGGTIGANQTLCAGADVSALNNVVAGTGEGTITYRWEESTNNSVWNTIAGETNDSYDPGTLMNDRYYRRVTISSLGIKLCEAPSNVVLATVNNISAGIISSDQVVCDGDQPDPINSVNDGSADGSISYQWEKSTDNINWASIANSDIDEYTPEMPGGITYYRRVITSVLNGVSCSATSNTIALSLGSSYNVIGDPVTSCGSYILPWGETVTTSGQYSHAYTADNGCDSIVTITVTILAEYNISGEQVTACESYSLPWGEIVTSSGDYSHTYLSAEGCDSVVTIHVNISQEYTVTAEPVSSCGSYTLPWGEVATSSGYYSHTYLSISGCDSVVTIHVSLIAGYEATGDAVTDCDSYTLPWSQIVTSSGDYSHTYTTATGCDSTVTIHVTINSSYNESGASATACDFYVLPWNQTVTSTGNYSNTYQSVNGCDSTVTIHVTINPGYNVTGASATACGSHTLPWGQVVTSTGNYNHTYSSVAGCDSTVTVNVTINSGYNVTGAPATACDSHTLPWGQGVTTTGNYTHTYLSAAGCDSIVTIHVTINGSQNVTGNPVTACNSHTLPWGQVVTATGDYAHTFSSLEGCDNTVTIHVTIHSSYDVTGDPATACDSHTLPWGQVVSATGNYNHIYSSIDGCDSTVTIYVTINENIAVTGTAVTTCDNYTLPWDEVVTESGNYSHTYLSATGCDSTVTIPVTINSSYSVIGSSVKACNNYTLPWGLVVTATGNYSHSYLSANGCDSTVTIHVKIKSSYNITGEPATACDSYILPWGQLVTATGDYNHTYSSVDDCDSTVTIHVTVNSSDNVTGAPAAACESHVLPWGQVVTTTGNYNHTYSSVNGCDSTVTIHVTINSGYDVTGAPAIACDSHTLPWGQTVTATGNYSHNYSSVNGCDSIVTIHVTLYPGSNLTTPSITACDNYTLPWGHNVESTGIYSHTYTSINGCDSNVTTHVTIHPSYNTEAFITSCGSYSLPWGEVAAESGNYSQSYSSVNGCDSTVLINVTINPVYNITDPNIVSCGSATLPWGQVVTSTGTYSNTYTSSLGCDSTISIFVKIHPVYNIVADPVQACDQFTLAWGEVVTTTGDYSFTYTSIKGCDSTVTVHVSINPSYIVTGASAVACDSYLLPWGLAVSSSGNYTHTYSSVNGCDSTVTIHVTINSSYNVIAAPVTACVSYNLPWGTEILSSGNYTHAYTSVSGCDSMVTIPVTINPEYTITGPSVTACGSYLLPWEEIVTTSGSYSHTYFSANGCDSIVNIHVTVNPNYSTILNPVTSCDSYALPWGQVVTASGNYDHNYYSIHGCDSVVAVQVNINHNYNITNASAYGCDNYTLPWGEIVISTANYNHTYTSVAGCDSVVSVFVTINPSYNITGVPVTACGNYLLPWGEVASVTNNYSYTYYSMNGCDSVVTIHVTIHPSYNINVPSVEVCGNYTLPWGQTISSSGSYSYTYLSVDGCDSMVTHYVQIYPTYSITDAPVTACGHYTLPWGEVVNASGTYSHNYYSVNGCDSIHIISVTINPEFNNVNIVNGCDHYLLPWGEIASSSGTYSHTYASINDCDSTVVFEVNINPTVNTTLDPVTTCDALTLPWNETALMTGEYAHTYSSVTGCDSIVTIQVTVNNSYQISGGQVTVCGSHTLPWGEIATSSGSYSHVYSSITGCDSVETINVIVNATHNITVDPVIACISYELPWNETVTVSGNYSHTYSTVNGCDSIVTYPVIVNSSYNVAGGSVSGCTEYVLPWGQVVNSTGNYSNTYTAANGCDSVVTMHVTINPVYDITYAPATACGSYTLPWGTVVSTTGSYSHSYESVNGCDSTISISVTIHPDYEITADPVVACVSYVLPWNEIVTTTGSYTNTFYTANGCDSIITIPVTIHSDYQITEVPVTATDSYILPWGQTVVSTGSYSHTYLTNNGCDSVVTVPVTINPSYNVSGGSVTACVSYELPWGPEVTVSGEYSHTYSSITGTDSVVTISVTINPAYTITEAPVVACVSHTLPWGEVVTSTNVYNHTYFSVNGCDSVVSVHVTINSSYDITEPGVAACNNYELAWGDVATVSGNYSHLYVSVDGCDSLVTVPVTINQSYDLIEPAVIACGSHTLPWNEVVTQNGDYSHTYLSVSGCDSTVTIPVIINPVYNTVGSSVTACGAFNLPWGEIVSNSGNYAHTYYSINGCDSIVTVQVTIYPLFNVTANAETACNSFMLPWEQIVTSSGNYDHVYSSVDGCDSIVTISVTINPSYDVVLNPVIVCSSYELPWGEIATSSDDYSHTYSTVNGCDSTVTIAITVYPSYNMQGSPVTACNAYSLPWGELVTSSGSYSHNYGSVNGCDSIVSINVIINSLYNTTGSPVIACNSYTLPWGATINSSGDYSYTYSAISGCDSVVTIHADINPVYNVQSAPVVACGSHTLPWGETITSSGNYSHSYSLGSGCDSIVNISVTINQIYNVSLNSAINCVSHVLPWGEIVSASGIYTHTYFSITGCDSVVTASVTIHPAFNTVTQPVVNCQSYTLPWGQNVISSGNYDHIYTSVNGCDSVVTVPVTINPAHNITTSPVTACESYVLPWGENVLASGSFTHHYTSVNGCDSIVTVPVTINEQYNVAGAPVTSCVSHTLPWGLNVTSSGSYSYTYFSVNGCDSTVTIPVTIHPSYNVVAAPVIACASYTLPWGVQVIATGSYSFTYTSLTGCDSVVTVPVTINPLPAAVALNNSPLCEGATLNLSSSGGMSYVWSGPNGFTSTIENPSISNAGLLAAGIYSVTVTNSYGCTATAVTTVTIYQSPVLSASSNSPICSAAGGVCSGFRTQTQGGWGGNASGNNPGTYRDANFAGAFPTGLTIGCSSNTLTLTTATAVKDFLPSGSTTSVLPAGAMVNPGSGYSNVLAGQLVAATLSVGFDLYDPDFCNSAINTRDLMFNSGTFNGWTVAQLIAEANNVIGGCSSSFSTTDLNDALDQFNNNYVDGTQDMGHFTCPQGNELQLFASGGSGVTYSWTGPNGFSSSLQNPTIANVTSSWQGNYTVTATNSSGCSKVATVSVVVNTKPVATASSVSPLCSGNSLNLSGTGGVSYLWTGPNGFTSTLQNPVISNASTAASGSYSLVVTNSAGCTASTTVFATVNAKPVATASATAAMCQGGALNLTSSGGGTYVWSGPNGFTSTLQNPVISNATTSASGTYTVVVTNASGCTASATASATVNAKPVATASSNSPVCPGSSINLSSGNGGSSYSWTGPNGFTSSLQNPVITSVSPASAGTYTVTIANASGCIATASISVSLSSTATYCASNGTSQQYEYIDYVSLGSISRTSGADAGGYYNGTGIVANVSQSTSYTLTVSAGFANSVYSESWVVYVDWNGDGDFSDSGESAGTFSTSGSGNYTATINVPSTATIGNKRMRVSMHYGSSPSNCGSQDYGEVEDYTLNILPKASANSPVCAGTTLNLSTSGGSSYSWTGPNGFTSSQQNPAISNVSTAAAGTYNLIVTNSSGCSAAASTIVTVNPATTITSQPVNSTICEGGSTTFTVGASGNGLTYQWKSGNSTISGATASSYTVLNASTGNTGSYKVVVTGTCGSSITSNTASLTVNDAPDLSFSVTNANCNVNGAINLTVSGGGTLSYLWSNGATSQDLSGLTPGTYSVTVSSSTGCTRTGSATVGNTCPKPTNVSVSSITTNSATVSWTGVSCALNYKLRYKPVSSSTWTSTTTTSASKGLTSLTSGTLYEVQVETFCNATDSSGYTSSVQFTTTGNCANGTSLSTTNITTYSAKFNWSASVDPQEWEVSYKKSSSSTWTTVILAGSARSYTTPSTLYSATSYQWRLRAKCNGTYTSYSSTISFTTLTCKAGEEELNLESPAIAVYPNPNNGQFIIDLDLNKDLTGEVDIQVFNALGQLIYLDRTGIVEGRLITEVKLNDEIPAGSYFVRIISGEDMFTREIICQQ